MKARAADAGRRVAAGGTAGGAAGAPNELETREAEAGMCNGRGEADLGAQRRDHEGPRVEHGAGAKRAPLALGGRRRSLSKEDADLSGPPASGTAKDQAANRRE